MSDWLYQIARPVLMRLDPEDAHRLTIQALRSGGGTFWRYNNSAYPALRTSVFGLSFPNPIGLAPGFDKNVEVLGAVLGVGFGFTEVGTITPRPQPGNPRPRLFRLQQDEAVINRMGFNNTGMLAARTRLLRRPGGIVGINIGANKDSHNRIADYCAAFEVLHPFADYITINVSSPNTPGLRGLQDKGPLQDLLHQLGEVRGRSARPMPLLLKIAPDLDEDALAEIVELVQKNKLDGLVISNTTIARAETLRAGNANEGGGLSGAPLFEQSTAMLAKAYHLSGGDLPLIGVGGVGSARQAYEKILAGASLVQLYSALVFQGPGLVRTILKGLQELLASDGFNALSEAVGAAGISASKRGT